MMMKPEYDNVKYAKYVRTVVICPLDYLLTLLSSHAIFPPFLGFPENCYFDPSQLGEVKL